MNGVAVAPPPGLRSYPQFVGRLLYGLLLVLSTGMFGVSLYFKFIQGTSGCDSTYNAAWAAMGNWCFEWYQAMAEMGITAVAFESYFAILRVVTALPFLVLSLFLVWRRSDEMRVLLFAGLLLLMGFAGTWFNPFWQWGGGWFENYTAYPALKILSQLLTFLLLSGGMLFAFLFPDGQFVPHWSRRVAGLIVVLLAGNIFFPGTFIAWASWPFPLPTLVPFSFILLAIAAVIIRYRQQATETQQQQIKWVTLGFLLAAINYLLDFTVFNIYPAITGHYPLATGRDALLWELGQDTLSHISHFILAICFGLAILRHRLWDIDPILNRTLVYSALTVTIVTLYIALAGGMGLLFRSQSAPIAGIIATGIIAILFQPMRERLQRSVNRLLYGERDDPAGVLTRLTSQLEMTGSGDSLLNVLVETIASSLKLPYVALWLYAGDGAPTLAAEAGSQQTHIETLPLLHQQENVGQLVVASRSPGEALSTADRQLLAAIARLTATTARTIQLTDQVQEARIRTVSAREEERRRLRRDLHDGLGPVLASQGLKLAAARQLLREKPEVAERLLDEVMSQSENTVAEIRRLVYALRPPTLDELGLVEAIREHVQVVGTNVGVLIVVDAPAVLPEIPAAIEVAAFRVIQEALNNVIRHAQARHCAVSIAADSGLHILIQDDGVGLGQGNRSGVGLQSMRERAAEVGGVCTIENGEERGVFVRLSLPL
jgi:signal transduction histidine kinase